MTNNRLEARARQGATTAGDDLAARPFAESLPMALLRAREAAVRLVRPLLGENDLTEQQWRVLRALAAAEPLEAGALAAHTSLLGPSLSRILSNLEQRELINREPGAQDLRRSVISLSTNGREVVRRVAPHSAATYSRIEQLFGADRLQKLLAELDALARLDIDAEVVHVCGEAS